LALTFAVLLVAVLATSVFAHSNARFPGDLSLELRLQGISAAGLQQGVKAVSKLGDDVGAAVLVVVAAVLFWVRRHRGESLFMLAIGVLGFAGRELKPFVDRPRPTPNLVRVLETESTGSFPSGHSIFAFAFFGMLFYLAGVHIKNAALRMLAQAACVVLILLIGASRVYLGAHWPSDVIGGYLVGALVVACLVIVHKAVKGKVG